MRKLPPLKITPDTGEYGPWQFYRQRDFTGGENKLLIPEFIQQNQLITAQNCELTPEGIIQTRKGKTPLNTSSLGDAPIRSIFIYTKEGDATYLVVHYDSDLYAVEWDGVSEITFGSPIKESVGSEPLRGVVWKDVLILSNGVVDPFIFDGTVCTDIIGTPPKFKIFTVYSSRLWVVDVDNPNIIRWSGLEDYNAWDALDILKVRDADGDVITGLVRQSGGLIVTKNNSVWPIYGTNKDNLRLGPNPIEESVGCISDRAIVSLGNIGLFLGTSGIFNFDITKTSPIFNTHKSVIKALSQAQKAASFAVVQPYDRKIYFHLGNDTTLTIIEQEDLNTKQMNYGMFTWTGLNASCFAIADAPGFSGELLIGDSSNGFIYILNNTIDDDGVSIETIIRTAYNDCNSINEKVWRRCNPEIELVNTGNYLYEMSHDVDYSNLFGMEINQLLEDLVLDWDLDDWNTVFWTYNLDRISTPYFLEARGERISFGIKSNFRLKFLGYTVKYREVGYL